MSPPKGLSSASVYKASGKGEVVSAHDAKVFVEMEALHHAFLASALDGSEQLGLS